MRDKKAALPNLIFERRKLLARLGGLPEPVVENKGWLYLLKEETRNSIQIEGLFLDEEELEKALAGTLPISRNQKEALHYFKAAGFVYGLAYENYQTGEFLFGVPLIRQINKILGYKGRIRNGAIWIERMGYRKSSTRQLIRRGKIIAVKKGRAWYSTETATRWLLGGSRSATKRNL